jgi:hypothetical protein
MEHNRLVTYDDINHKALTDPFGFSSSCIVLILSLLSSSILQSILFVPHQAMSQQAVKLESKNRSDLHQLLYLNMASNARSSQVLTPLLDNVKNITVPAYSQITKSTAQINFLTYQNSTLGLKIQYPSNWQKEEHGLLSSSRGLTFTSPVDKNSANYPIKVFIDIEPLEAKSIEQYTLEQIDKLREDDPSFNIISASTISLSDNTPAGQVVYMRDMFGIPAKEMQIYTIKGSQVYTIWYLAQATTYDKYLPTVQKIIDSLEIAVTNGTMTSSTKTYQNSTLGIKIQYPNDWSIKEKDGVVFYAPDFSDSGAYVEVFQTVFNRNVSLDEDLNETISNYEKNLANFRILELDPKSTLAGSSAYDILYDYIEDGTDTKVKEVTALIDKNKEYSVRYYSEAWAYAHNLSTVQKMISSLTVSK